MLYEFSNTFSKGLFGKSHTFSKGLFAEFPTFSKGLLSANVGIIGKGTKNYVWIFIKKRPAGSFVFPAGRMLIKILYDRIKVSV